MKLRSIFVISVVLLSFVSVPVSASVGGNSIMSQAGNETSNANDEVEQVKVELTDGTDLVDYQFDTDNSTVTVHFRSAYKQRVTVTDAFIPPDEGMEEINQRSIWVNGEKKIEFGITEVNGQMGFTVQAGGGGLYGVVESSGLSISAEYTAGEMAMFILSGTGMGITLVLGVAYKRKLEITEEIEKWI